MMTWTVRCECGSVFGERCPWSGPARDTVIVEYMPVWLRESHVAARNKGVYPHNGAERLRVERSGAERIVEANGDWASIVEEG